MKKILFTLLLMASLSIKAAPQWTQYDNLLSSPSYIEQVEYTAKFYARKVLETIVVPTTAEEIKRYNWCQDVLNVKTNSIVIYKIASFVCNDTYIPSPSDPTDVYNQLLNAYATVPNVTYTVFDIIGKVNLP